MEPWFIYAILSAIFAGLFSFAAKISAQKKHNPSEVMFYAYVVASVLTFLWWFIENFANRNLLVVSFLAFSSACAYYISVSTRIRALSFIDSTIYFPLYKTFGPIIATILGVSFFADKLSLYEVVGIVLGIIIPLFLITKQENLSQTNLKKGIILVMIGSCTTVLTIGMTKYTVSENLVMSQYFFFQFLIQMFIAGYIFKKSRLAKSDYTTLHVKRVGLIGGILLAASAYVIGKALVASFSVVFTVNAFSLLVPIVLSIIIYKEHIDLRKSLVIFLSVVSLLFFAL